MIALAAFVIGIIASALAWREVKPLLERKLSLSERTLAIEESKIASQVQPAPQATDRMPADLVLYTIAPAEEWARDEAVSYVWGLYREHKDWTIVRQVVTADELNRRQQADYELGQVTSQGMIQ